MAVTDNTSAGLTGSSEESTLAEMFKSVLTELKELKETVAHLVEPVYEDKRDDNVEQGEEESTAAGVDKHSADDPGNKPSEMASGSKQLLPEIVRELDISEKTGLTWIKAWVSLMWDVLNIFSKFSLFPKMSACNFLLLCKIIFLWQFTTLKESRDWPRPKLKEKYDYLSYTM